MIKLGTGILIAFEGIDGSGTTTHSRLLKTWLENQDFKVRLTTEPTKNPIGLLLRKSLRSLEILPATDALLFAADRMEHSREIDELIKSGHCVLSDRYIESSYAYQTAQDLPTPWIIEINRFSRAPTLNILLDVDPDTALRRKQREDKFETNDFLIRVREIYLTRARADPKNWHVFDSSQPINQVQNQIREIVSKILSSLDTLKK